MAWFKKSKEIKTDKKVKIPEGLWVKCESCREIIYKKEIDKNLRICPKCNYHFRISAKERLELLVDEGSFVEMDAGLSSGDPLNFKDKTLYKDKLRENKIKTGLEDAAISGEATVEGHQVVLVIMDFSFIGGSMGSVVGEKIMRAAEAATETGKPLITVASSGGARMQEGIFSLMQMARVSAAVGRLKDSGMLFISVLADPTFGGVTASFAMLGDVILAEPKSLIGFAGKGVIEQTIKQQLPEDFQRAEFLLEHGFIDKIVDRKDIRKTVAKIIELLV
ncbi:acetyl-CoA carboxylase, beta (carboxyltranferase) subunit [Candidatus Sulfobium mesophilum]|uniref:Acetyl-coenzyme A carboxylase carboxyl transferase subunit beta n=1 Tax=Candidatus Sulfobium mesophilum TaxID=2016548 RepID=A0A2U3QGW9_9BACT|nr:acetyl-CoA carboxylase, beta (carboxyltranferase) subunit [Candidatus Sulfobium mesophilum]